MAATKEVARSHREKRVLKFAEKHWFSIGKKSLQRGREGGREGGAERVSESND